ncbi:DUF4167 domain-containing protein [Alphaproteobacteria bacterium]|jgi:hypothetical protein|nr:DUF4167 domain-containing protein [Alphaproteobacteria bacterium]
MKNYPKRKPFGSSRKINSGGRVGVADSPYLQNNGNSNGFKRNGKNPKDQYNDFLNKAKDAKGQGDDVLEQFYLQHAEHYYRQIDHTNRNPVSRKIISKEKIETDQDNDAEILVDKQSPSSDFDDLANQLA